jgi:hypothetical protein
MPLTQTDSGLVFHESTWASCPAWLTEVTDASITYAGNTAILDSTAGTYAFLVTTADLDKTTQWVTRVKLMVGGQNMYHAANLNLATIPAVGPVLANDLFRSLFAYKGAATEAASDDPYDTEIIADGVQPTAAYAIFEVAHSATQDVVTMRTATGAVDKTATWTFGPPAPVYDFDPFWAVGDILSSHHTGTFTIAVMQVVKGLTATVSGLVAGNHVDVTDPADAVVAHATSAGASVAVDISTLQYPYNGKIKVYDSDGGTLKATYTGNVYGGWTGTYTPPVPVITSLTPDNGYSGDTVTVAGTDFGATQGTSTVTVSGVACTVVSWADTSLSLTMPASVTGSLTVTTDSGADSETFTYLASPILRFTDGIGGSTLLNLNDGSSYYYIDGSSFPLPKVLLNKVTNESAHGSRLVNWRFDDNKITLMLAVHGSSETDLDAKVRVLLKRLLKEGWLEFRIWNAVGSLFYRTRPVTPEFPDWTKKWVRDQYWATDITIEVECEPEVRGSEVTLHGIETLGTNDNWADKTGGVPDGWTEIETNAGTVTFTDGLVFDEYLLNTTNGGTDVAGISEDDYTPVDITKHHQLRLEAVCTAGSAIMDIDFLCYDDANNLVGTIHYFDDPYTEAAYIEAIQRYSILPIEPADWPAGTTKIKRTICNDSTVLSTLKISHLWFGVVDYVVGHKNSGVIGIVIPGTDIIGDFSAKMDVHINSIHDRFTDLALGQRRDYSSAFDPVVEPSVGSQVYLRTRRSQDYRTIAALAEMVVNGNWSAITGGAGNTTNWTNWAETRTGTGVMQPDGGGGIEAYLIAKTDVVSNLSDAIAVDPTDTHRVVFRGERVGSDTVTQTWVYAYFYNVGATLIGSKLLLQDVFTTEEQDYIAYINPADFPTGTTSLKFYVVAACYTSFPSPSARHYWRSISLSVVTPITATFPVEDHEGRYYISAGVSFGASNANDDLALSTLLKTTAGQEMTGSTSPQVIDPENPNTKFKETLFLGSQQKANVPSHMISDAADKSNIDQCANLETEIDNAVVLWTDHVALVPRDRAYVEVRNWADKDHLIFDSRSSKCPLVSLDGTLDTAQIYDPVNWKSPCSFEADPDGVNMTLVAIKDNDGDHEVTPIVDITLKYHPVYLLVK